MKKTSIVCLTLLCFALCSLAQENEYSKKNVTKKWVRMAQTMKSDFYYTPEALRIADNVLLYQISTGAWPKNINMAAELSKAEKKEVKAAKNNIYESTIDNGATVTEIRFLSQIYQATHNKKYKKAVLNGIKYLLEAQYDNGGWPQFYPCKGGYYTHITYNDNAMVNVMVLLKDIVDKKAPYTFVPEKLREKASIAFDKGVECILKTQVKQNGELAVWCAQHDEFTFAPAQARAYELPSLSGSESAGIVCLLLSIPQPSPEIVASIEGAVKWFKANKVIGLMRDNFVDEQGRRDYRMVPCPMDDFPCPILWARFYTIEDNRPLFCDRDGVAKYNLSDIGYERRNGYSWYNEAGKWMLQQYEAWQKNLQSQK